MTRVDTTALAEVVGQCFEHSTDGRFTPEERARFLVEGKRLRGLLMNLLSAQFIEGTEAVASANAAVRNVNADLKVSADRLAGIATTLNNVARLVGTFDRLLNVAVSFV
jgi:hypothetical protein